MKSLPYFPFYPGEWLRSPTVLGMSLFEQGAYLRLLCVQWEDGAIDPEDVPLILGIDPEQAIEMLSRRPWKRAFVVGEDGLMRNPRLSTDRETAQQKVDCASAAASARWAKHRKKGRPKIERKNSDEELNAAIAELGAQGIKLPESLQAALHDYKETRREKKKPVWSRDQWLKNLAPEYTFDEWEEAYHTAIRSGWASVHPKKSRLKQPSKGNKALETMQEWVNNDDLPY